MVTLWLFLSSIHPLIHAHNVENRKPIAASRTLAFHCTSHCWITISLNSCRTRLENTLFVLRVAYYK